MANKKFSWNAKTPMTSPDMVANPIKWNPMSEDWKKRVEAMQLYNEDATAPWLTNEMKKTLRALRDRILLSVAMRFCSILVTKMRRKCWNEDSFFITPGT